MYVYINETGNFIILLLTLPKILLFCFRVTVWNWKSDFQC